MASGRLWEAQRRQQRGERRLGTPFSSTRPRTVSAPRGAETRAGPGCAIISNLVINRAQLLPARGLGRRSVLARSRGVAQGPGHQALARPRGVAQGPGQSVLARPGLYHPGYTPPCTPSLYTLPPGYTLPYTVPAPRMPLVEYTLQVRRVQRDGPLGSKRRNSLGGPGLRGDSAQSC